MTVKIVQAGGLPDDLTEEEQEKILYPYLHALASILAEDYRRTDTEAG